MEPETRYTLVGTLVIALVAAAAFALVWLQGAGVASEFRFYTIYFERQSLEGLQVGGDVNMRGIKVGRVEAYRIERENINRVKVTVRVGRVTPVSENTEAVVDRNLVTGIARINLVTPEDLGPPLDTAPENEAYPVIAEGTSDLQQIARTANSVVAAAEATLRRVNEVINEENVLAFREALIGVRDVAQGVNRRLDTIDSAVVALRDTARSFQDTALALTGAARAVQGNTDQVGGAIVDIGKRVEPILVDAGAAMRETRATLQQVGAVLGDLTNATRTLERDASALARRAGDATDVGVLELRATAQQLRSGVDQLSRTLERLEDPRSALLGPGERKLGPGERLR
ncbi:MAG: MCE family protein [Burkholderiaceae bacterium]|nr:MCE family protein [Burkholderiaceae bacterium]